VALTGVRRPAEIEENVGALEVTLTAADHDALAATMRGAAGQVADIPR
jgi:aryl-alcohol dehydrogenase-like predicted oxidoreductase